MDAVVLLVSNYKDTVFHTHSGARQGIDLSEQERFCPNVTPNKDGLSTTRDKCSPASCITFQCLQHQLPTMQQAGKPSGNPIVHHG